MLTLLEEVVLLTIDPRTGHLSGDRQYSVPYALAGAVLFDLALAGRIDTDVDAIAVLSVTPTGNTIQDEIPSVRDIMLVSLADACGLLTGVVTEEQREARAERIDALSHPETIARNVISAIGGLYGDMSRGLAWAG